MRKLFLLFAFLPSLLFAQTEGETCPGGKIPTSDGDCVCPAGTTENEYGACDGEGGSTFVAVSSISLEGMPQSAMTVPAGFAISLNKAVVYPENATYRNIVWNVTGATYNSDNGEVVFDQPGQATIIATIANGSAPNQAFTQTFSFIVAGEGGGTTCPGGKIPTSDGDCVCPEGIVENENGICGGEGGGSPDFVAVTGISSPFQANEGGTYSATVGSSVPLLNVRVYPTNATNRDISWIADGVASYNTEGNLGFITFNKPGQAKITAIIKDGSAPGSDFSQTFTVNVIESDNPVCRNDQIQTTDGDCVCPEGIVENENGICGGEGGGSPDFVAVTGISSPFPANEDGTYSATVGSSVSLLNVRVYPTNATNRTINWIADGVASYRTEGNLGFITFNKPGQAKITAIIKDGYAPGSDFEQTFTVNVIESGNPVCRNDQIPTSDGDCVCPEGIVENENGICGGEGGSTFVAVTSISLDGSTQGTREVQVGSIFSLNKAVVYPENATYRNIVWSVAGATYDRDNGEVVFDQPGQATIRATIANGSAPNQAFTQTFSIIVAGEGGGTACRNDQIQTTDGGCVCPEGTTENEYGICDGEGGSTFVAVTSISLDGSTQGTREVQVGSIFSLNKAVVYPENATYRNIVWSVNGATHDRNNSEVVFDQLGQATITATIANGSAPNQAFTQTFNVSVVEGGGTACRDDQIPTSDGDCICPEGTTENNYGVCVPIDFVEVSSISLEGIPSTYEVSIGFTISLNNAIVYPKNATYRDIIWSVNGASYNSDNGEVVFDQPGQATIIAEIENGLGPNRPYVLAAGINVVEGDGKVCRNDQVLMNGACACPEGTVPSADGSSCDKPIEPEFIAVRDIEAPGIPSEALVGDTILLTRNLKISPANATNTQINWDTESCTIHSTSNGGSEIVLNNSAYLSCGQAGTVTITATIAGGKDGKESYAKTWQIQIKEPLPPPTQFVAVESINAYFSKTATVGNMFSLGIEKVQPTNATNKNIIWSVSGASLNGGNITFDKAGVATITAKVAGGKSEAANGATGADYVQEWKVIVSPITTYKITMNLGSVVGGNSESQAGVSVSIKANAAPNGQEFEKWKITSKGKPVELSYQESIDVQGIPTLSFIMPKMDLEVTVSYKPVDQAVKYELAVSGGTGAGNFEEAESASVNASVPDGYVFGYWDVFPIGIIEVDNKNAKLNFSMPKADIVIRAVFSKKVEDAGKTIEIASIVESAKVEDWVSTTTGESIISAEESDNGIEIKAEVSEDGFAAIESDISPNAAKNDSIVISYTSDKDWRLYLNIPGIPYAEGYFVELPANSAVMQKRGILAKESSNGAESFTISDFKNEAGETISTADAEKVTGMSFSPVTGGEATDATINIAALDVYMQAKEGEEEEEDINSPIIAASPQVNFLVNSVANGIMLQNLPQNSKVGIYSVKGRAIYTGIVSQNSMQINATPGIYIIQVKAAGVNYRKTLAVK